MKKLTKAIFDDYVRICQEYFDARREIIFLADKTYGRDCTEKDLDELDQHIEWSEDKTTYKKFLEIVLKDRK